MAKAPPAVGLLLAGSMLALPFVLINPQPLAANFQAEWLAIALGLAAAIALLVRRDAALQAIPQPAWWLIAFALFLVIQGAIGNPPYWQMPLLGLLYALYAALMIWLGMQLAASAGAERTAAVLATFLLAGALANAAAGIIQFYGRPAFLEDWVAQMRSGRSLGNVSQINLYANYLALGQAALLYLWLGRQIRSAWAILALLLLAYASALSGTRSALIFLVWIAILGLLAARILRSTDRSEAARIAIASCALAIISLLTQFAVPWLNGLMLSGSASPGSFERLAALSGGYTEPRWQAWLLAWRIFLDAPLAGAGMGAFAGTAFKAGLHPDLAGYLWSSPHNLVLHLLAETGIVGAALAIGALVTWWWQTARRYRAAPNHALWLAIAVVGIETLHSMLEFPLWNAQFLGATALLMGTALAGHTNRRPGGSLTRYTSAAISIVLVMSQGVMLRDYLRLDASRIAGTRLTLAAPEEKAVARQTMQSLASGPLGPLAEGWILLGADVTRDGLAEKLAMSGRVIQYWPGSDMLVRHAAYLALAGRLDEADALVVKTLRAFPRRCSEMRIFLQRAREEDSAAFTALLGTVQRSAECRGITSAP
jgi:O-antigen ligase